MNLPALYAAVCAKRPELAASVLYQTVIDAHDEKPAVCGWFWHPASDVGFHVHADLAAALILARWVEALPCGVCLVHGFGTGSAVQWWIRLDEGTCCTPVSRTPLEALAAYYLEETT